MARSCVARAPGTEMRHDATRAQRPKTRTIQTCNEECSSHNVMPTMRPGAHPMQRETEQKNNA
eukprot:5818425-Lingulodinium_polyedra.AAC.1